MLKLSVHLEVIVWTRYQFYVQKVTMVTPRDWQLQIVQDIILLDIIVQEVLSILSNVLKEAIPLGYRGRVQELVQLP